MQDKKPKRHQAFHPADRCLFDSDLFLDIDDVVSTTECTGLIQTPPRSHAEAEFYTDLYGIPTPSVQKKPPTNQTS